MQRDFLNANSRREADVEAHNSYGDDLFYYTKMGYRREIHGNSIGGYVTCHT